MNNSTPHIIYKKMKVQILAMKKIKIKITIIKISNLIINNNSNNNKLCFNQSIIHNHYQFLKM